jgi:hypothetical protein
VGSGARRDGGGPSVGQLIVAGGSYGKISDGGGVNRADSNRLDVGVVGGGNGGSRGLSINAVGTPDSARDKPIVFSRVGRGQEDGNKVVNLYQDQSGGGDQRKVVFGNALVGNGGSGQSGPVSVNESFSRDLGTLENRNQTNGKPSDLNLYVGGEMTPIRDSNPTDRNYLSANYG